MLDDASLMRPRLCALATSVSLLSLAACSSAGGTGDDGDPSPAASQGGTSSAGSTSAGGTSPSSAGGMSTAGSTSGDVGGSGGQSAGGSLSVGDGGSSTMGCASEMYDGQLVPLDMVLLLDRSASMQDDDKWGNITSAIEQFVGLPAAKGISIGLQFFPLQLVDRAHRPFQVH